MAACPILGFAVQLELAPGANADALWRAFIALLEGRGLQYGDSGESPPTLSWLVSSEAGQATELDREAVVDWLKARAEIADFGVGPLVDLERST